MKIGRSRILVGILALTVATGFLPGCGGGDGPITNDDPGLNDVNVIDAFGDSITQGGECNCAPYPGRVSILTGKVVVNSGIGGSRISSGVSRVQSVINNTRPGFMVILYGVNDVIHGGNMGNVAAGLTQIVQICRQNNVVPILATYPIPILGHSIFAGGTASLNVSIRAIASSEGVKLVDLEYEFADPSANSSFNINYADPTLMMPDGLHPNDAGTQIIAISVADLF